MLRENVGMQKYPGKKKVLSLGGLLMVILLCVSGFLCFFTNYIDKILYDERLGQMSEVTKQLFSGLNDVVENNWEGASVQRNTLQAASPTTLNDLYGFMEKQEVISEMQAKDISLIAVDSTGKYYKSDGPHGLMREIKYLDSVPRMVNYVSNTMTSGESSMVYLYELDTPVTVQDDNQKDVTIIYYGTMQNMKRLNKYFNCSAYNNENSVYVLDEDGMKLFNSSAVELVHGYNIYNVLKQMKYYHNQDFDKTLKQLEETGSAYSSAVLDGVEYYYAIANLDYAEWTILFMVPASCVAVNTVRLTKTVMIIVLGFATIMVIVLVAVVSTMIHIQQKKVLDLERENNHKLAEALDMAREANRSKSTFLANMSHDIRTPMNAIIGITALIEHDVDNAAKVKEYAKKIEISSQHLLGLINDVLDMSKIESGKTTLNFVDFSISEMLRRIEILFRPQTDAKNQTLLITKEHIHHEWLNGDSVRLMQVFNNLMSNAIKYTKEGGRIQFFAEECQTNSSVYAKFRFVVKDNGIGMSEEFQDKIFDSFTREENSVTNKIQGTGLGMAISKNLIQAMGGTIEVKSEKGKGSCFEVIVDIKIAENKEVYQPEQIADEKQDETILNGMCFLCAEDNELNAEILKELLDIEGAKCQICENGEKVVEAFEKSQPGEYDMILMDIQMPVMNGYEATKAIRNSKHPMAKTIPIIAMTANAFSEDIQQSFSAGMNAHVSKPVEMKVLGKAIQNIKAGRGG
jgi:signal transduction histidine kinase